MRVRWPLTVAVTLLSIIVAISIAVVLANILQYQMEQYVLQQSVSQAADRLRVILERPNAVRLMRLIILQPDLARDPRTSQQRPILEEFDRFIQDSLLIGPTIRFSIW